MPDQPDQAPAPAAKPAPVASPEVVKGRFMARTAFGGFEPYAILVDPTKALHDMHRHQMTRLQNEPVPPREAK